MVAIISCFFPHIICGLELFLWIYNLSVIYSIFQNNILLSTDLFESDEAAALFGPLPARVRHPAGLQATAVCVGGGSVESDRPGRRQCWGDALLPVFSFRLSHGVPCPQLHPPLPQGALSGYQRKEKPLQCLQVCVHGLRSETTSALFVYFRVFKAKWNADMVFPYFLDFSSPTCYLTVPPQHWDPFWTKSSTVQVSLISLPKFCSHSYCWKK